MDLALTREQELLRRNVREFATREIAPGARERDRNAEWPGELFRRMGDMGLLGFFVPPEYGGTGPDAVGYAIAMEEVSHACASLGVLMSIHNSLLCDSLVRFGSDAQRREHLPALAVGKRVGCFSLTEPASGSDASTMDTVARRDGDAWVIDGSKNFATGGGHADIALVFAMTTRGIGHRGVSAFLVPTATPGFVRGANDDKVGIRAAHSCSLFFEGCRVPDASRLGDEGGGFKIAMSALDGGRIGIAAQALGIARAAYEKALAYARERRAFGSALADKQAIQIKLADMATDIDAARLLVHRAAWMKDHKQRHTRESAMAKLFASETASRVTHAAVQIFGGIGYTRECDAERHWRDARVTEIYEGTSEILRLVIAAQALKEIA